MALELLLSNVYVLPLIEVFLSCHLHLLELEILFLFFEWAGLSPTKTCVATVQKQLVTCTDVKNHYVVEMNFLTNHSD